MSAPLISEFSYRPGQGQPLGPFRLDSLFLYAEIDSVGGTSFDLYELPKKQSEIAAGTKTKGGVVDVSEEGNFSVLYSAIRVPSGLTGTTGDDLMLSTAIDVAGPKVTASGSAFAAGVYEQASPWFAPTGSTLLGDYAADRTFKLFSVTPAAGQTPAATGHTVKTSSGTAIVIVRLDLVFHGQARVPEVVDVFRRAQDE